MIRAAVRNRVSAVVATPPIAPGQEPFPDDDYKARLEETGRYLNEQDMDFLSTDCRDMPGRSSRMPEAYERLKMDLGEERALQLTHDNAHCFLRESSQYEEA